MPGIHCGHQPQGRNESREDKVSACKTKQRLAKQKWMWLLFGKSKGWMEMFVISTRMSGPA
jgi:hypothetical protein